MRSLRMSGERSGNRSGSARAAAWLLPLLLLAACAQQAGTGYSDDGGEPYDGTDPAAQAHAFAPSRYYAPPGTPEDPWGPYIREAAARYRVPAQWVRAVMHQESGGREQAVSPVGAMGLMQVMPATYEGLRARHALGNDPYDPHNNILAGTAYIREMYDRYGAPGFLAAYNAGPDRVDSYLNGGNSLPDETANYLAAITPNLGNDIPLSGPLAMYAGTSSGVITAAPSVTAQAAGCDVNAAYDPDRPCATLTQAAVTPVTAVAPLQMADAAPSNGCDPNAAYDPDQPCQSTPAPVVTRSVLYQPAPPPPAVTRSLVYQPAPAPVRIAAPSAQMAAPAGGWAIQVGAFATPGLARAVAEGARTEAPIPLRSAVLALPPTTPFGGSVLYRARLANLSASAAADACSQLNRRQLPCIVVSPTGS
jgi:D-alanyl-D-alanine carboxypeptidase